MATLSLEKVSLVTRGHHVEVVAVGPHKIGYRASLRGLTFFSPLWGHTLKNSRIGYRASLRGLTFISPLWGHTLKRKKKWVQG